MSDKMIKTSQGELYYVIKEDRVNITSYAGEDEQVIIPEMIAGLPVRKIDKKAFMNAKRLKSVILPDSIRKLAEWSFSYCRMLTSVELPRKKIAMGHSPFLGDDRLQRIVLRSRKKNPDEEWLAMSEKDRDDTAVLLASLYNMKNTEHLLNCSTAGTDEWFEGLDRRLLEFIDEPDEEGHAEMILCGEEDLECTLDVFVTNKRKKKSRAAFLRLLHSAGLTEAVEERYKGYLLSHVVGCESDEAWQVMKEELGHLKEYYEYYVEIGCLNDDNFTDTIVDLGDKQAEMKAYFLRWKEANKPSEEDFFDSFEL
jgi:hypothetical protein